MRAGILVVGEPESLKSTIDTLTEAGHFVRGVSTDTAMSALRDDPPELILLDALATGAEGWELCRAVQSDPDANGIPLMLLGSDDSPSLLARVANQLELGRLRDAVAEQRLLLQETHHRVKNNLQWVNSLLFLQAAQSKNRDLVAVLEATQGRVRSMALIHEALYRSESLASVSFREYLEQLCRNLWEAFEPRSQNLVLELSVPDIALGVDRVATCGLLVNELITNSFKHGYTEDRKGRISVTLDSHETTYALAVCDDGRGPAGGVLPETSGTMGLQLIGLLTAKLRGRFSLLDGPGWGARIEFPMREPGVARG